MALSSFANASDQHYAELFEQANLAYKLGSYDSAKTIYHEISNNGILSAELFYNLGNCYFKTNQNAAAILNYERALRINPSDEDIIYNLEIANSRITDKIDPIDRFFLTKWWHEMALSLNPDTWAFITILLFTSALALLLLFKFGTQSNLKKMGLLGGIIALVFTATSYSLGSAALNWMNRQEAIVFAPTVNVKSEPSNKGTDQFVLHEGIKVEILSEESDWVRIKLEDGNSGWIQRQSIESI